MNEPLLQIPVSNKILNPQVQDVKAAGQDTPYMRKVVPLSGKMVLWPDPMSIGFPNFAALINMRYTDTHPRAVGGQTQLNTTPLSYPVITNAFQFRKQRGNENHILLQCWNSGSTSSGVIDHQATVPSTGEFDASLLFADSPGAGIGMFSLAPDDCVCYCNGEDTVLWSGEESRVGGFINFDPNGTFRKDYTDLVKTDDNTSTTRATLTRVLNGVDPTVKTLLHFDNNVDDATANHTWTASALTYSTDYVFGDHSANFNGSTGYLHTAANADFDLTSGEWTRAFRIYVDTFTHNRSLYYQESAEIKKIAFGTGAVAPAVGDTVNGQTSSATGVVNFVEVITGTWAGGNATGYLYLTGVTGTWQNGENIRVSTNVKAITTSTASVVGTNYVNMYVDTLGAVHLLIHYVYSTYTDVDVYSVNGTIQASTWYFVEFTELADNYYIFVGQEGGTANIVASLLSTSRALAYTSDVRIGSDTTYFFDGKMDEVLVSLSNYHTSSFLVPVQAYGATYSTFVEIRSTRALDGLYLYLDTVNTSASDLVGYQWVGTDWDQLTGLSDGTATGPISLSKSGKISFDSTVGASVVKESDGGIGYVYMFIFNGIDDGVTVYYCTLCTPIQPITDIWDGVDRPVMAFYKLNAVSHQYMDYTLNVFENSYTNNDSATYCSLSGMLTTQEIVVGLTEQAMGVTFAFIQDTANTTPNTVVSVYRSSDGINWDQITRINDSTSADGISFAQSGSITWTPAPLTSEFKSKVSRITLLYHYKFKFNKVLSSGIKLFYVAGIPAPTVIDAYKFSMSAQDRLFLGGNSNRVRYSAVSTNCVFNGDDSGELVFEDATDIVGGCSLFGLLGSTLYNLSLFFDTDKMFVLAGTIPNTDKHAVSYSVGLAAPRTLCMASLPDGVAKGLNRNIAIWQAANGIYISDGRSPIPIHNDIRCFFLKSDSRCITPEYLDKSYGFIDLEFMEYHWIFYSGVSGDKREMVFDLTRWKWFEIDRTSGKMIDVGICVLDSYGNVYSYGFSDGNMYRLEYGTTFDGEDISCYLELGDMVMVEADYLTETSVVKVNVICVANSTSTSHLTYTHYNDTTTTDVVDMGNLQETGKRIKNIVKSVNSKPSILHSASLSIATDDEVCGFEPILMEYYYQPRREHIKET